MFFFWMVRRPPKTTQSKASAASGDYKRELGGQLGACMRGRRRHVTTHPHPVPRPQYLSFSRTHAGDNSLRVFVEDVEADQEPGAPPRACVPALSLSLSLGSSRSLCPFSTSRRT